MLTDPVVGTDSAWLDSTSLPQKDGCVMASETLQRLSRMHQRWCLVHVATTGLPRKASSHQHSFLFSGAANISLTVANGIYGLRMVYEWFDTTLFTWHCELPVASSGKGVEELWSDELGTLCLVTASKK